MERFLGTVIGGVAAMAVLFVDDYLVPEILGWNARAHFYLVDVAIFTVVSLPLASFLVRALIFQLRPPPPLSRPPTRLASKPF